MTSHDFMVLGLAVILMVTNLLGAIFTIRRVVLRSQMASSLQLCVDHGASRVDRVDLVIARRHWRYWWIKRMLDIIGALVLMVSLTPLMILISVLVTIDVGLPIVFWQQRIGHFGHPIRVYKFRTMRSSFDRHGNPVPDSGRMSLVGRLLRSSYLDEFPQLFNVLIGDMSLIGPRPLLPVDQSESIRLRFQVRPGIIGLAQINGGTSLSPEEKDALDEWYIRHASLTLDLKIVLRTIWVLVRGNQRNDTQISTALTEHYMMNSKGAFQ
jgi:lipopolysaccharide/colanic/teichoic acid biosynthesis glycosyltransferase